MKIKKILKEKFMYAWSKSEDQDDMPENAVVHDLMTNTDITPQLKQFRTNFNMFKKYAINSIKHMGLKAPNKLEWNYIFNIFFKWVDKIYGKGK